MLDIGRKQNEKEREAGGGQAAARDAATAAKLEGGVVFRDVRDYSARTGVNVSIVDGDNIGRWFDGFARTRWG